MKARKIMVAIALVIALSVFGVALATPLTDGGAAVNVSGQGLSVAAGAVGLQGIGSSTRSIALTLPVGAQVQQAFLYWGGNAGRCATSTCSPLPTTDQQMVFDGDLITGAVVGSEPSLFPAALIAYRADVTGKVQAKGTGALTFPMADGDTSTSMTENGAVVVVMYRDPAVSGFFRVQLFDGGDFAYDPTEARADLTPENRVTAPINFSYAAATVARTAQLDIFAVAAQAGRPDRIDISHNASLVNQLAATAGAEADNLLVDINVPAGSASTTVQLFSAPSDQNPDSLFWVLGALRIPCVGSIGDFVWNDLDHDGIQEAGEPGIAGVTVRLTQGGSVIATTTTDSAGMYLFQGLCGGTFTVQVDETTVPAGFVPTGPLMGGNPALDSNPNPFTLTLAENTSDLTIDFGYFEQRVGGQGCTPGFWKQAQHFDSWVGYTPNQSFDAVFGVSRTGDGSLLNALKAGGGGENALGRHAVAALLNTASSDVSYGFSTAEVIALVQQAYASGSFETIKNQLEVENEQGCPLQ